ncbi:elmMII, partial [Symbiodinium natans]
MDMAMCLKLHASILVEALGESEELSSASLLSVKSGGRGAQLLSFAKICTLMIHPIHAPEMEEVYPELLRLVEANSSTGPAEMCDWPEQTTRQQSKQKDWKKYMATTFHHNDDHVCWDLRFTWRMCCHPSFGPGGNSNCWDDENTWERCCNRTSTASEPPKVPAPAPEDAAPKVLSSAPGPPSYNLTHVTNQLATGAAGTRITAVSGSFSQASGGPGNPKCWSEGFTFDLCCRATASECWSWPFTHGFCCEAPLPPRPPLQAGGLPEGLGSRTTKAKTRTSRCPHATSEEDLGLLACQMSLDEIGALFELPAIGSGDKASGWHDYLGNYERLLFHLPLTANVLEFGVRMGSSLAMWSEYFPHGTVVGMDKNLLTFHMKGRPVLSAHGAFTRGNVYVMQANASDQSGFDALGEVGFKDFDVIVDDANHWAKDQIARFELYFPSLLRPGGVYLIEDVHIQ